MRHFRPTQNLSPREEEVLRLAGKGLTDKLICEALDLRYGTINDYWKRIRSKLCVASRTEAATAFAEQETSRIDEQRRLLLDEIAERKKVESALRESEALTRALLETASEGIVVSRGGKIVFVNESFEKTTGWRSDELIGTDAWAFANNDDSRTAAFADERNRLARGENVRFEHSFHHRDGREMWLIVSVSCFVDLAGNDTRVSVITDITEQKRLERALEAELAHTEAAKARLHSILDILPVGVGIRNQSGDVETCNGQLLRIIGDDNSEGEAFLHARKVVMADARTGRILERHEYPSYRAMTTGERIVDEEIHLTSMDGLRKRVLLSAAALTEPDGTKSGAVITAVDITELEILRQAEADAENLRADLEKIVNDRTRELASANRELGAMDHALSHEVIDAFNTIDRLACCLTQDHSESLSQHGRELMEQLVTSVQKMRGQLAAVLSIHTERA